MPSLLRCISNGLRSFNRSMAILSAMLIVVATMALVYEVITRYFLTIATDWVIEFCIYLLIAATFLSAAYTQSERGHVGIEVLEEVMSAKWNRVRLLLGDILSVAVIAFIANNAWHYSWEAYQQGWTTDSTWAPPLWIPYLLMAFGLTTLALQIIVQIFETLTMPVSVVSESLQKENLQGA